MTQAQANCVKLIAMDLFVCFFFKIKMTHSYMCWENDEKKDLWKPTP